ncbi:phosphatidylethanolamine N-methyltransferase /phosphatidyl-N-methylethanolamine N-methyltransferase [Faunimonas pinastri]|uniref:Phosphatidylethanolamine N-methyltransferase /phosphatidyl-N-methylethanolamine N-methyltransferase n=1 Tax=Faunimonas pinastri TaxID=1855383 RepID=A0A1H9GK60_9HYPH|nr:rRNA adenine N-6-methyltransferase family protein [Faunimonas pinastri]SEQ50440.1 phosphatidylethanolamine N-methyltransferase /phosphatidyl-N-methylethanolamine N-methyltransferase [Faunimonas pinastri]
MTQSRERSLRSRIGDDVRFFKTWTTSPLKLGAVTPTSRALSRLMVRHANPDPSGYVLELGPGTGVVTEALLEYGIPAERIVSIEYDRDFATLLQKRFPAVNVIRGDAFALDQSLGAFRDVTFSAVLSGVPILTMPRDKRIRYIEAALDRMPETGVLTQLSYALTPPQDPVPGRFTVDKSKWVTFNLPPGRVWMYRKPTAG